MEMAAQALETGDSPQASKLLKIARTKGAGDVVALIEGSGLIDVRRPEEKLMDSARRAVNESDRTTASRILKKARAAGNEEAISYIEQSGLLEKYRDSRLFMKDIRQAVDVIESRTKYRLKDIDQQNVRHGSAKSISFQCPDHGVFAISSTTLLGILILKDSSYLEICPICRGFKKASDRLQVNIKLSLDHSQKISELLSYYNGKSINFMGASGDASATSSATSLGRFIIETAIEEIYYEMLNKRQISQLADWIQFDEFQEVSSAVDSLGSDPSQHVAEYTPEYEEFLALADAKLLPIYLKRARSEWQEMASSIHFDELFKALWYEAIGIALSRYQSSPTFVERDAELLQRLKRIRSKDGGLG